jgi:hypothetical protein
MSVVQGMSPSVIVKLLSGSYFVRCCRLKVAPACESHWHYKVRTKIRQIMMKTTRLLFFHTGISLVQAKIKQYETIKTPMFNCIASMMTKNLNLFDPWIEKSDLNLAHSKQEIKLGRRAHQHWGKVFDLCGRPEPATIIDYQSVER